MPRQRSNDLFAISLAIVVSLPTALVGAAWWARLAPLDEQTRFVSAFLLVIPVWTFSICLLSLPKRFTAGLVTCATLCAGLWSYLYQAT